MAEERVAPEQEVAAFEFVRARKQDFQFTFAPLHGQEVLRDLSAFCRANDTCFDDPTKSLERLEGRREVWLRIQRNLNLTPEMLYALATGRNFTYTVKQEGDDDA